MAKANVEIELEDVIDEMDAEDVRELINYAIDSLIMKGFSLGTIIQGIIDDGRIS